MVVVKNTVGFVFDVRLIQKPFDLLRGPGLFKALVIQYDDDVWPLNYLRLIVLNVATIGQSYNWQIM